MSVVRALRLRFAPRHVVAAAILRSEIRGDELRGALRRWAPLELDAVQLVQFERLLAAVGIASCDPAWDPRALADGLQRRWQDSRDVDAALLDPMVRNDVMPLAAMSVLEVIPGLTALRVSQRRELHRELQEVIGGYHSATALRFLRTFTSAVERRFETLGDVLEWVSRQPVLADPNGLWLLDRFCTPNLLWDAVELLNGVDDRARADAVSLVRAGCTAGIDDLVELVAVVRP